MDFIDELKQFSKRVESIKDTLQTEEATKTSILLPFFQLLGFDIFNPNEFVPEFTADVGIKKGEKVDYAILQNGEPVILVEAKSITEPLDKHSGQLFRYFGTTTAKIGILTNGQIFKFYTDLDEPNKMDEAPFLEFDILDIKDTKVPALKQFCKSNFDLDKVITAASDLKYTNEVKNKFNKNLTTPSDSFVRFFISDIYGKRMTQPIVDKFRPIVKKALNQYISETLNDKIQNILQANEAENEQKEPVPETADIPEPQEPPKPKIVTTADELEAYFIIKNLLKDMVPPEDITLKDTVSYCNILYKNNSRKWICRLRFDDEQKSFVYIDNEKNQQRIKINNVYDLEKYAECFRNVLSRFV